MCVILCTSFDGLTSSIYWSLTTIDWLNQSSALVDWKIIYSQFYAHQSIGRHHQSTRYYINRLIYCFNRLTMLLFGFPNQMQWFSWKTMAVTTHSSRKLKILGFKTPKLTITHIFNVLDWNLMQNTYTSIETIENFTSRHYKINDNLDL